MVSPSMSTSRVRMFLHRIGVHRWRTVLDTRAHQYRQCDICQKRRIDGGASGGHQPRDLQWIETGRFIDWSKVQRPTISGARHPTLRVIVIQQPGPDQVGPVQLRKERIE